MKLTEGNIQLTRDEFQLLSTLLHQRFGIKLTEQKRTLLIERLQKTLRQRGFQSFRQYYEYVVSEASGAALLELVDRVSTNHTFFFREPEHFTFLEEVVLPKLAKRTGAQAKQLRIWSAGCSSGEEPYTIAMVVAVALQLEWQAWDIGILATDISISVLQAAQSGIYSSSQLDSVPAKYRRLWQKVGSDMYQLRDNIRQCLLFRRLNLMNDSFPFQGKFDVIFCRNVMIYFDAATRSELVGKYAQVTQPEGYLMIGHSESINRNNGYYQYIQPAIYQRY